MQTKNKTICSIHINKKKVLNLYIKIILAEKLNFLYILKNNTCRKTLLFLK